MCMHSSARVGEYVESTARQHSGRGLYVPEVSGNSLPGGLIHTVAGRLTWYPGPDLLGYPQPQEPTGNHHPAQTRHEGHV